MSPKKILRSHRRICPFKVKLSMEDAPVYLLKAQKDTVHYHDPEKLGLYICTACSWLHIGHMHDWKLRA